MKLGGFFFELFGNPISHAIAAAFGRAFGFDVGVPGFYVEIEGEGAAGL